MKQRFLCLAFVGVLLCGVGVLPAFAAMSHHLRQAYLSTPIGEWWQMDEHTHRARSIIKIYADQEHHGYLMGKIVKAFPHDGKPPRTQCDLCKGDLYNAPIIGLPIMQHFRVVGNYVWGKGTILDPSSGKVYSCKLTLLNGGKVLKVRGYVGVPIFGRTQMWVRKNK